MSIARMPAMYRASAASIGACAFAVVPRATITAIEPTRALVLPIWDFRLTLRDFPDLAIHLIAILGLRLWQNEAVS